MKQAASIFIACSVLWLGFACGGGDEALSAGSSSAGAGGACEPETCEEQGLDCGEVDDGCGRTIECGPACSAGAGGAGPDTCALGDDIVEGTPRTARRARSAGFSGTYADYAELYEMPCNDVSACTDACLERGGQQEMCEASECLPNGMSGNDCLPAPVWDGLESLQFEDASIFDMTQIILVNTTFRDTLLADQFKLEVPEGAEIRGVTVEIRRAGGDGVADHSLRIIKGGEVRDAERAQPQTWSEGPTWVSYGGADDLWGETWTPAQLNADDFGVALAVAYTQNVGNTRAYVDQIRVTVSYVPCD